MQGVIETADRRLNFTATATITQNGSLIGIFVSSTTGGTIKVEDADGTIVNTFTPAAATFYRLPFEWHGTLTITVANTIDATAFYRKN